MFPCVLHTFRCYSIVQCRSFEPDAESLFSASIISNHYNVYIHVKDNEQKRHSKKNLYVIVYLKIAPFASLYPTT